MKKYISHFNAAYHWEIPNLHIVFDEELNNKNSDIHFSNITAHNARIRDSQQPQFYTNDESQN